VDIYEGPVDPTFQTQIHDFNPGIASNGLFWTTLIPAYSVAVSPGSGAAAWNLTGFPLPDYGTLPNGLFGSPIGSGVLDMTMTWSGGGAVSHVRDPAAGFVGRKVTGTSHIEFTVGFGAGSYTASSDNQVSVVSEVWKERNGSYFS